MSQPLYLTILSLCISGLPVKTVVVYFKFRELPTVLPPIKWIRNTMTSMPTAAMSSHLIIALKVRSMNGAVETSHAINPIITIQIINANNVIYYYSFILLNLSQRLRVYLQPYPQKAALEISLKIH